MLHLKALKGYQSINDGYKHGIKFQSSYATANIVFKEKKADKISPETKQHSIIYFAVIIGKKISKKAVIRNRIKRLMRESLKQLSQKFYEDITCIEQIIISYHFAPKHQQLIKLKNIMPAIEDILMQAFIYYNGNNTPNCDTTDKTL